MSGETGQRLALDLCGRSVVEPGWRDALLIDRGEGEEWSASVADGDAGAAADSTVAISVPDAIEGFYLGKIDIDRFELLAQALDVAVDRTIIDIDVLAIGGVHQLVAVFDVSWTMRERFEDQELGHGKLDRFAPPGA